MTMNLVEVIQEMVIILETEMIQVIQHQEILTKLLHMLKNG